MEIQKLLALSTSHVSKETAALMDNASPVVTYDKAGYGWFVYVPNDDVPCDPPDLAACFTLAHQHKCQWIMFDRDVAPLTELPTFNW